MMPPCALCGSPTSRVIYMGLPMRLCEDDACAGLDGLFARVLFWFPIATEDEYGEPSFSFLRYEGYSYPEALWIWLTGKGEEE